MGNLTLTGGFLDSGLQGAIRPNELHEREIMAIDLTSERGLRPCEAAKVVPPIRYRIGTDGRSQPVPTHPATIVRWIVQVRRMATGEVVRLAGVRTPGGWVTTATAAREFFEAITPSPAGKRSSDLASARDNAGVGAGQELEFAGLCPARRMDALRQDFCLAKSPVFTPASSIAGWFVHQRNRPVCHDGAIREFGRHRAVGSGRSAEVQHRARYIHA